MSFRRILVPTDFSRHAVRAAELALALSERGGAELVFRPRRSRGRYRPMKVPLKITYRNMDSSPSLERSIREQVSKLERLHDGIIGCRVTVESPHHSHTKGNHYRIRVEVTVPGREIVADRGPDKHDEHEDPFVAVRDAFRAAQRGLLGYLTRRRELRRAN